MSTSNSAFLQQYNRQKLPLYDGDTKQWPKYVQAMTVALMATKLVVETEDDDGEKSEKSVPLHAMIYFQIGRAHV